MYFRAHQLRRTVPCPFQKPVTAEERARWKARGIPTVEDVIAALGRATDREILRAMQDQSGTALTEREDAR